MMNPLKSDIEWGQKRRRYAKPTLNKIGALRKMTQKTGSTMDALTGTASFTP